MKNIFFITNDYPEIEDTIIEIEETFMVCQ
jgi:hypothetical protein